jgi:hypothetical protein
MHTISLADAMWQAAESVVNTAKKAGIDTNVMKVYNNETAKTVALIARLQLDVLKTAQNIDVEVVKD